MTSIDDALDDYFDAVREVNVLIVAAAVANRADPEGLDQALELAKARRAESLKCLECAAGGPPSG